MALLLRLPVREPPSTRLKATAPSFYKEALLRFEVEGAIVSRVYKARRAHLEAMKTTSLRKGGLIWGTDDCVKLASTIACHLSCRWNRQCNWLRVVVSLLLLAGFFECSFFLIWFPFWRALVRWLFCCWSFSRPECGAGDGFRACGSWAHDKVFVGTVPASSLTRGAGTHCGVAGVAIFDAGSRYRPIIHRDEQHEYVARRSLGHVAW
jgi:hypothetical protein